jgi:hypothetical protein
LFGRDVGRTLLPRLALTGVLLPPFTHRLVHLGAELQARAGPRATVVPG